MWLKKLLVKWAMGRSMMRAGSEKVQVEAGYGRWESADFPGEEQRPGCQAEPWGRGEGRRTWAVGTAGGGYQQPFTCEPESFLNSALTPSLPLCLPSTSHHLFSAPQMWSSVVRKKVVGKGYLGFSWQMGSEETFLLWEKGWKICPCLQLHWPKISWGFFHKMVQKHPNELFTQ